MYYKYQIPNSERLQIQYYRTCFFLTLSVGEYQQIMKRDDCVIELPKGSEAQES
jgi:hypothetical protein